MFSDAYDLLTLGVSCKREGTVSLGSVYFIITNVKRTWRLELYHFPERVGVKSKVVVIERVIILAV